MKAKKIMLAVLLVAVPFFGFAQEWMIFMPILLRMNR